MKRKKINPSSYSSLFNHSQTYLPYRFLEKMGIKNLDPMKTAEIVVAYSTVILLHAVVFFSAFFFQLQGDRTIFFLLFFFTIIVAASLGGLLLGFFSTVLALGEILYLFTDWSHPKSLLASLSLLNLATFFIGGILVSYLIDLVRHAKEIQEYKKRSENMLVTLFNCTMRLRKPART